MPRILLLAHAEDASSMVADDYNGTKLAVRRSLDLVHRRIACSNEMADDYGQRRRELLSLLDNKR